MTETPKVTEIHYSRIRKRLTWEHLTNERGSWEIRLDTEFEGYDSLEGKWVKIKVETSFEPLEKHGMVKELQFNVLFVRITTDKESLQDLRAYFVQAMKASVPTLKIFQDVYLVLENQEVFVSEIHGTTMAISLSFSEENRFAEWLEKIDLPKRLTDKEAVEMWKKPNTLGVYEESRDGDFTTRIISNVRVSARG